jgi:FkbM family methyltransferase
MVIFDVGANIGDYTKDVLSFFPNSQIYAFEPHPQTFNKMQASINSSKVNLINKGCGITNSVMEIYDLCDQDGSEHATLYKGVIEGIHQKSSVSTKVKIIKLDDYCKANKINKINLLKIDTEGNEYDVLCGASKMIAGGRIDIIHFEFNSMNIVSRHFFKDFYDLLKGYLFYRLLPNSLAPIRVYEPLFCEIFAYQNIVAINKKISGKLKI